MYTVCCTICNNDGLGYKDGTQCSKCFNKKCTLYQNARYAGDSWFRLKKLQRSRIRAAIVSQNARNKLRTLELIGCSADEFKHHIESQFTDGQSWSNYGRKWHVDHITPISAFDLRDPTQQELAFNFKNIQPLDARLNLLKGAKII